MKVMNGKVWPKMAVSYADRGLNVYIGIQYYVLEVTIEAPNLLWIRQPATAGRGATA